MTRTLTANATAIATAIATAAVLCGCGGGDDASPAPAEAEAAADRAVAEASPAEAAGDDVSGAQTAPVESDSEAVDDAGDEATGGDEADSEAVEDLAPDEGPIEERYPGLQYGLQLVDVTPSVSAAMITERGGDIVAGDLRLQVGRDSIRTPVSIQIRTADPSELRNEGPPSLVLGAMIGLPEDPGMARASRLTIPLLYQLEPGMELEALSYVAAMRSYYISGRGTVNPSGRTATFEVSTLGEMIVRARPTRPERVMRRCPGPWFNTGEKWPGQPEASVTGIVPLEDRVSREIAFSTLTDFRLSPWMGYVDFKNEEVNNRAGTGRDERDYQDEDYLMDPNAAAAVAAMSRLVAEEWRDPITGDRANLLRVTESFDSLIEHSSTSTHYQGRGIDLTLNPVPPPDATTRRDYYGRLSRLAVCAGFDYVHFENRYHVHASVVASRVAVVTVDDEGQFSVYSGKLFAADELEETGHAWREEMREITGFEWTERNQMRVVGRDSNGVSVSLILGRNSSVQPGAPATPVDSLAMETADGMRRLSVLAGVAWLSTAGPLPAPGAQNGDGSPVRFEDPYPIAPGEKVVAAAFLSHERTSGAVRQFVVGGPTD